MISVKNLIKIYRTPEKQKGWAGVFKNIFNRQYKETKAIDDISFKVNEGELVGLIGPNGAGKTSTMKILSGILYPASGKVDILGFTPFDKKPEFLKKISFIMGQRNQLLWDLPAVDSFLLNKEIYEVDDSQYEKTLNKLAEILNCKHLINQPVKTLSLGERMKMELIASVLHQPKVLFLDEPTIGLDVVAQKTVRDFIKEYQRLYKATILLTSHYMGDVEALAQRVMVINQGRIIFDGLLENLIRLYAKDKLITVITDKTPDKNKLILIDNNYQIDSGKIIFKVERKNLAEKVAMVSRYLDIKDINIEEEKIEDIIRKIFNKAIKEL